ncbi:MAG: enoyl-CoA hydratase/isomerase family protein [Deltaproteobacteria bacterium]|nr:enoyl-CoA hydratase/isomerase family protein [Deltaproteobacteria bacterium]
MDYKNIILQVEQWGAAIIFNRPKALNAMNAETLSEIQHAISVCKSDDIKVLILTGSGEKAFVAGADIREMQNLHPSEALAYMEMGHETMRMLETLPKPTIAAVNGFALGGGTEIALSCDMRFASENARFGQPEILLGSIPGWGGTQRLGRIIGMGRAKEIIYSGEQIDAKRAYEIGLVNRIYTVDQLFPEAVKFAEKLAALPSFALKMAKHSINFGYDMSLDNATRLEAQCCAQCFSMEDQKEGMSAFLEKRKPNFSGR